MSARRHKYPEAPEGEWDEATKYEACCDCGLVHRAEYSVVRKQGKKPQLQVRKWRENRRTGQLRRRMRERGELVYERVKR